MNGIKTLDWLKCNICFNSFDDSCIRPRSLSCGHTFCERCLKNTFQNGFLICPQCRKSHKIKSVLDLSVNFTLEGILKSLNTSLVDVSDGATQTVEEELSTEKRSETLGSQGSILEQQKGSAAIRKKVFKTSSGICHEHPSMECMFCCLTHMCWVCELCINDDDNHSKKYCEITSFMEEIEQRKQEHIESLEDEEEVCDETLSLIQKHVLHLTYERERHISAITSLQNLVSIHKKEEENLKNAINSYQNNIEKGKNVKEKLLDDRATVLNAATLDESNTARELVRKKKAEARNWINASQKEILEEKIKIADSTSVVSTEKSLEYRQDYERTELTNKTELDSSENNASEGSECQREYTVDGMFFSCLECRTEEGNILCGTCFVNSVHVNHMHDIRSIDEGGYCDCGSIKAWKSNPTCMKHLKKETPPQPEDINYALSKCKEVFFDGEKTFSCLDCRKSTDGYIYLLCGSCFINSSHRHHTYEIFNSSGEGGYCDCGREDSWKSEHVCDIHADSDIDTN